MLNCDVINFLLLEKFGMNMDVVAVGDDETLTPLFDSVALAIVFNPGSKNVEKHADIVVKSSDLRDVLPHLASKI